MQNFQSFVFSLIEYWGRFGCLWTQPYDSAMGAGTFHPHTFLKGLGPEPWRSVYVQPCRRPVDGRYGESPYRFQHYYQLQVFLKPAPSDIVDVFLRSLEHIGIHLQENDISLLEDDWKGPTLGAWGLGWEVRANGQEVTQFTYFQQLGGLDLDVVSGEITYGLERLYMYATGLKNALDIPYNDYFSYGDIFKQNEFEFSHFNFKNADVDQLFSLFSVCEEKVKELCATNLVLPAYDYVLQASHAFNLLDARGAISVSERQRYIGRVRDCARLCATAYRAEREKLGFPMMTRLSADPRLPFIESHERAQIQDFENQNKNSSSANTGQVSLCVELGVEEMPPSFQTAAVQHLEKSFHDWMAKCRERFAIDAGFVKSIDAIQHEILVSARRLVLLCKNLPETEPSVIREFWGPAQRIARAPDGTLTAAATGFAKKIGVETAALEWKERADGTFLYAEKREVGGELPILLANEFVSWCQNIESGLKMKWIVEEGVTPFVRPVRWICALANDKVLPIAAFGLKSSNLTFGQRILHPRAVKIAHADRYVEMVRALDVEPSWSRRRDFIQSKASQLASEVGGVLPSGMDGLLDKVAGLSESPQIFVGKIPEKYMRLPERLITSVLREHMNYLSVVDSKSGLAMPYYIGVAGYPCSKPENMVEATATVVSGRLDDGAFYYDGDLKTPLHELHEKLSNQLFQAGMGSLKDKSDRIAKLARTLAGSRKDADEDFIRAAETAGLYCKADLKSGCVQEFPDEMQGLMGGILVREQRLFAEQGDRIASAIAEHYAPAGANAALPSTALGKVVSLADKIDSLVVLVGHGTDIKGNKDPYGLRRLALAILRLLGADGESAAVEISLTVCLKLAIENCRSSRMELQAETEEKVFAFMLGRLRALWKTHFDPGAVEAVSARLSTQTISSSLDWVKATSRALVRLGEEPAPLALAMVPYKRCRTLTEDLLKNGDSPAIETEHFIEDEEKELYTALERAESEGHSLLLSNSCEAYLGLLADLRHPMANFFDRVLVNAQEFKIKQNRLALLLRVRRLYDAVADFSLVQVAGNG
ncbi:glycine--tRNA ligase subunit beta [bacterium]|nr:glycine--tRNA ligase subunit beta [bacterium]